MSGKLMTPAEIERCAKVCELRAGYHAGGNEFRQWESKDCADTLRALQPMFGDVPAGWPLVPAEPTTAMADAMTLHTGSGYGVDYRFRKGYAAMPAAAPTAGQ